MSRAVARPVSLGGKEIWPPFTIPSGIVTVNPDTIVRFARDVPIGMITTKSIGRTPFDGYPEPVISQYSADGISSAIGLSTMGHRAFVEEMRSIYPLAGKVLVASVFGSTVDEFVEVATALAETADAIELNFCCPHSLQYGAALIQQGDLTEEITRQVRRAVALPVVVKLTPNADDIGDWARRLVAAGADAVAAIGPTTAVSVHDEFTGAPVLSFGSGGLSGPAITGRALDCIRSIRARVDVPIIASGGISTAADVLAFRDAGANVFSVGTSLAGMGTDQIAAYFADLFDALVAGAAPPAAGRTFDGLHLRHQPYVVSAVNRSADMATLRFDGALAGQPGQFVFAWLPGVGEKPFSLAGSDPLVFGIRIAGKVSAALAGLSPGDTVMVRGPFGRPLPLLPNAVLVGGGCGVAPLRLLAQRLDRPLIVVGATSRDRLIFVDDFRAAGETIVMTDDGSAGGCGTTIDALRALLAKRAPADPAFYNCGPERMIAAAMELERDYAPRERIFTTVERHTVCGVGLCGKCSMDGYRMCVDGPGISLASLSDDTSLGVYHRGPSGVRLDIGAVGVGSTPPELGCYDCDGSPIR